jgi:2'-5' RNA ligase
MPRLFTALDLPNAWRRTLSDLRDPALEARWTDADQYHVTLRFIGDVSDEQADAYEDALQSVDGPVPQLVPYGLDALPSRTKPRVLMLGLKRSDALLQLYDAVSEALEATGLAAAQRTYRPHVTLARAGDANREAVHQFLYETDLPSLSPVTADRFHLYESDIDDEGATHQRRASYALSTGAPA